MQDPVKQDIRSQIEKAISDPSIVVAVAEEERPNEACPETFNGNHKDNIVNRICKPRDEGGQSLHIEQSKRARVRHHKAIAKAVADVIRPKIEI